MNRTQFRALAVPGVGFGRRIGRGSTRLVVAALLAGGLVLAPGVAHAGARNVDLTPPSTPGRQIPLPTPFGEFGFGWAPSTDDRGVVRYDVFFDNQKIADTTGTSYIQSAPAPSPGIYAVRAVDAAGNLSPFSTYPIGFPADTAPPSTPVNLRMVAARGYFTSSWDPSTDNLTVAGYEVTVNGVITRTGAPKLRFPFPGPGVYTVQVRAFDGAGNFSAAATISIAVDPPPARFFA